MKRDHRFWIPTGLALLAFALLSGALGHEFTNWDDPEYVTKNPLIKRLDPEGVGEIFTSVVYSTWAPVKILSYAIDHAVWGMRPFGYHLTNIFLHVICTLLLYLLLSRILGREASIDGRFPAAIAAALFAIHPVQVESVAWIAERKNVLGMALFLGAFLAWIRATRGSVRPGAYAAFLLFYAASLLTKLHAVILPPLLLAYEWTEGAAKDDPRTSRRRLATLLFLPFAMALIVGLVAISVGDVEEKTRLTGDLLGTLATAPVLVCGYVEDLLFPMNRSAVLPATVYRLPWGPAPFAAWGVVAGWALAAVVKRHRWPHGAFFTLWFLIALLPVLHFVRFTTLAADRYQYWAAPGLFALVGLGATAIWPCLTGRQKRGAGGAAIALAAFFAALTITQVRVWENSITLWTDAVHNVPGSATFRNNLASSYEEVGRLDEAEEGFRKALALDPAYDHARANLGLLFVKKGNLAEGTRLIAQAGRGWKEYSETLAAGYAEAGRWDELYPLLLQALEINPEDPTLHTYLGNYHFFKGDEEAAMAAYNDAIRLAPEDGGIWNHLGSQRLAEGKIEEALRNFRKAASLSPDNSRTRNNLGLALINIGQVKEAEREFRASVRLNSHDAAARGNLGAALIALGRMEEAEAELREAVRLDPGEANAVYNLACVSAVKGLPDEALRWLHRLVELGYRDADHLAADPDLATLRGDPRFISLLQSISGEAERGG